MLLTTSTLKKPIFLHPLSTESNAVQIRIKIGSYDSLITMMTMIQERQVSGYQNDHS